MVYDGKGHYVSTHHMLNEHNIPQKVWNVYRKRYPKLNPRDLINLIRQQHKK